MNFLNELIHIELMFKIALLRWEYHMFDKLHIFLKTERKYTFFGFAEARTSTRSGLISPRECLATSSSFRERAAAAAATVWADNHRPPQNAPAVNFRWPFNLRRSIFTRLFPSPRPLNLLYYIVPLRGGSKFENLGQNPLIRNFLGEIF